MKPTTLAAAAIALAAFTTMFAVSPDAAACGSAVLLEAPQPAKQSPVKVVANAERALERGKSAFAARTVLALYPSLRDVRPGEHPLKTRALRVFALAIVRSGGSIDEKTLGRSKQDWTLRANLEWAVQALRELDAVRPNDPTVQADLGEALSKLPHGRGEALAILEALARKDLIGSPHAYSALARLRFDRGDSAGAEAALRRCGEMALNLATTCKLSEERTPKLAHAGGKA